MANTSWLVGTVAHFFFNVDVQAKTFNFVGLLRVRPPGICASKTIAETKIKCVGLGGS